MKSPRPRRCIERLRVLGCFRIGFGHTCAHLEAQQCEGLRTGIIACAEVARTREPRVPDRA
eukprot:CAMPEP_0198359934 /NCGR_PEP_ID=MMETSP1450-20131203/136432_1 /TAXON_ID=753684 ORGANISM="Madagascaria erythrocladiodes, Strain CCMP3234" /NCGR_SAMPLE_ID=MMETSP1450 /ASSEMBLY_ACC=CAM_ASM_001115 /LENGTH=60 /DNA_ID=CAMNT_0044066873 /DNA_START=42 /DNA_END=221 /DNA_ORIENTATION=-